MSTSEAMVVVASVVFIQGGGAGAYAEDAPLARSLAERLGADVTVHVPRMPGEDAPEYERWAPAIREAIDRAAPPVAVVGHSLGAYLLLRHLTERDQSAGIAAVCIIAAPFPSADADWTFPGFELPDDLADRLPTDAVLHFYASPDDEVVPFAHLARYGAAVPSAVVHVTSGGHQLNGNLSVVADDIRVA